MNLYRVLLHTVGVLLFSLLSLTSFAQGSLDGMKYQAIIRDASGNVVGNQNVGIKFIIYQKSNPTAYEEDHVVRTNQLGLVNLEIGINSTVITGDFATLDWAAGEVNPYYILVQLDLQDGAGFQDIGESRLLSSPYAQFARAAMTATDDNDRDSTNELQSFSQSNDTIFLSKNGGFFVFPAPPVNNDNDSTNELNTSVTFVNDSIKIIDAGGEKAADLSSLNESADIAALNARANDISDSLEIAYDSIANYNLRITQNLVNTGVNAGDIQNLSSRLQTDSTNLANHIAAMQDSSTTNELQAISISNDTIYLTDGGFIILPAVAPNLDNDSTNEKISAVTYLNDTTIQLNEGGKLTNISLGALGKDVYANQDSIDQVAADLSALDKTLGDTATYLQDSIDVVATNLSSLASDLAAHELLDEDLDSTNEKIGAITYPNDTTIQLNEGGKVSTISIGALGKDVYANQDSIDQVAADLSTLNTLVGDTAVYLQDSIDAVAADLSDLEMTLGDTAIYLQDSIDVVATNLSTVSTDLNDLETVVGDTAAYLQDSIDVVATNLSSLSSDLNDLELTLGDTASFLQDSIDAVASDLAAHELLDEDVDSTNEIQALSISNDTIYLSDGGFVKLPAAAVNLDNDSTNEKINAVTYLNDTTIQLNENGQLTTISLGALGKDVYANQDSINQVAADLSDLNALVGDTAVYLQDSIDAVALDLDALDMTLGDTATYLQDSIDVVASNLTGVEGDLSSHITADQDLDSTNEIQAISISNDTIFLSNGGFVELPAAAINLDNDSTNEKINGVTYLNDTTIQLNENGQLTTISLGALGKDVYANQDSIDEVAADLADLNTLVGDTAIYLQDSIDAVALDLDALDMTLGDTATYLQDSIDVVASNLAGVEGDLSAHITADQDLDSTNEIQAISISNDTIFLSDGGFVELPASAVNLDNDSTNEKISAVTYLNDTTIQLDENGKLTTISIAALGTKVYTNRDSIQTVNNALISLESAVNGGAYLDSSATNELIDTAYITGNILTIEEAGVSFNTDLTGITDDTTRIADGNSRMYVNESDSSIRIELNGTERYKITTKSIQPFSGNGSVYIGENAGNLDSLVGAQSESNVGIGLNALQNAQGGSGAKGANNVAVGTYALESLTEGESNTAVGSGALKTATTSSSNTAFGTRALNKTTTGGSNTAIGRGSQRENTTGSFNTSVGNSSLVTGTSGSENVAIGSTAMELSTTGNNNTVIGTNAGNALTGSGNVLIGHSAGNAEPTAENKLYIDNSNAATPLIYGEFDNDSIRLNGAVEIRDGLYVDQSNVQTGKVLTADGQGQAVWEDPIDGDSTNEIQSLSISNDTIFLSDGGFVELPASAVNLDNDSTNEKISSVTYVNDTTIQLNENGQVTTLSLGALGLKVYGNQDSIDQVAIDLASLNQLLGDTVVYLQDSIDWVALDLAFVATDFYNHESADEDLDSTNEIQSISISNDTLFLTGGTNNYAVLPGTTTPSLSAVLAANNNAAGDSIVNLGALKMGSTPDSASIQVRTDERFSVRIYNETASSNEKKALWGSAFGSGSGTNFGLYGGASSSSTLNYGVFGLAEGSNGTKYAVYGSASGSSGVKYGIYGTASGGAAANNYAGYFENGKVYIDNQLGIGVTNPARKLDVVGDAFIDSLWSDSLIATLAQIDSLVIANNFSFPRTDGTKDQVLMTDGLGKVEWKDISVDLGDTTQIADDDNDTKVSVSAITNNITFTLRDTVFWFMDRATLEPAKNGNSVFIGTNAGEDDDFSDNRNVYMGYHAGQLGTTANNNVTLGYDAGRNNLTGSVNVLIGSTAGKDAKGSNNVGVGFGVLAKASGNDNVAIGTSNSLILSSGTKNVGVGSNTLQSLTSGEGNVALGYAAANGISTQHYNVAVGQEAFRNGSGSRNVAVGKDALRALTGNNNSVFGTEAYESATAGSSNLIMGYQAGRNVGSGSSNVFLGYQAGQSSSSSALDNNVFVGYQAGLNNTGKGNVFLGYQAGSTETGNDKLYINNASGSPLIFGDFTTDSLFLNADVLMGGMYIDVSNAGAGKVLTSDNDGYATWSTPAQSPWSESADTIYTLNDFIGIGTSNPDARLSIRNTLGDFAFEAVVDRNTSNPIIGAFGGATGGGAGQKYGGYFTSEAAGGVQNVGVFGIADSATINIAVFGDGRSQTGTEGRGIAGIGSGVGTNIGLYGKATGGTTNYAGYFDSGYVYIKDTLLIPTDAGVGKVLSSDASGFATWTTLSSLNTCPTGMVDVNGSYCIDEAERTAAIWFIADSICTSEGLHLASYGEWYGAASQAAAGNITLTDMEDDWEWTSNFSQNNAQVVGDPTGGLGRRQRAYRDPDVDTAVYRCVKKH